MVGTWIVAQDGADKVIMVDGRPWVASKDNPTKLLIQSARKLYGTTNEELMDNAKQFAYYPVAVLKSVKQLLERHDQREVQDRRAATPTAARAFSSTSSRTATGCALRYNDTENNVVLWEFHNGIRRPLIRPRDGDQLRCSIARSGTS